MNVRGLTDDQLKKEIASRLNAGEINLLLREGGRRGLDLDITYDGASDDDTPVRLCVSFKTLSAEDQG